MRRSNSDGNGNGNGSGSGSGAVFPSFQPSSSRHPSLDNQIFLLFILLYYYSVSLYIINHYRKHGCTFALLLKNEHQ